jgi:NTE family protein
MLGLVLTAGGARGAYQAGVLQRIGQLPALRRAPSPFAVVAGASAGAINGTMVAASSDDLRRGTEALASIWASLTVRDVFRSDLFALGSNAARFGFDLLTGGRFGGAGTTALLDTAPLRAFLARTLPVDGLASAIRRGDLYALALSATSYHSGRSYTFIQGRAGHPLWRKSRRVTVPVDITADHVYASAAIPIVFPPAQLQGSGPDLFFGDGGLRLVTPCSPAIRLGATRLLAIGVRSHDAARQLADAELGVHRANEAVGAISWPPLGQICGVMLNAIFLDHLDTDIEHLLRMNDILRAYNGPGGLQLPPQEPMRLINPLVLHPSEDLAVVASGCAHHMPPLVRWLLDGLGNPDARSADLMSYLLFAGEYTRTLIDIGYADASRRIDEIEAFLLDPALAVSEAG